MHEFDNKHVTSISQFDCLDKLCLTLTDYAMTVTQGNYKTISPSDIVNIIKFKTNSFAVTLCYSHIIISNIKDYAWL